MRTLIRMTAAALIVSSSAALGVAGEGQGSRPEPEKQWVWLSSQEVWGYGYQIQEGPDRGLWRIDPGTKHAPATGDPYGFADILNRIRAGVGLPPAVYDPNLSSWAAQNNVAQSNQGLGHHINPNCYQNCGWNYPDAESAAAGWMNSPPHRETMLLANMSRFGIAYGPGPYWTMNAQ
jgi:Cysteine-rich secretory protein family